MNFFSQAMPYKPTWSERLEELKPYTGQIIAGALVLALAIWLGWWALVGRKSGRTLWSVPAAQAVAREPSAGGEAEVAERARTAQARSVALESEATAARQAGRTAEAAEQLREAWRLQREANAAETRPQLRDLPRESRLAQELGAVDATPLRTVAATALAAARAAAAQGKRDEALAAYAEARRGNIVCSRPKFPRSFTSMS